MFYGDIKEDSTFTFWWNTFDKLGASITRATDGTIKVDRDDGTDCTAGVITDTEDDPDTGIHRCVVDASGNANLIVAHDYMVWVDGAVVDGSTINAVICHFSIENTNTSLSDILADTDELQSDDYPTSIAAVQTTVDAIEADTDELQIDDIPGKIATAQADLNIITGAAGVVLEDGTIKNDTFAADVGTTAHGTNHIALACRKILEELNLDHFMKVAVVDRTDMTAEVTDNTVLANIMAAALGDTSDFDPTTDSLEALQNIGDYILGPGAEDLTDVINQLDDIEADTQDLQAQMGIAGVGLTDLGGMSAGMKGEVNTEADTALSDINLDHLLKVAVTAGSPEVEDNTALANIMAVGGDSSDFDSTTDSLEAIKDTAVGGSVPKIV